MCIHLRVHKPSYAQYFDLDGWPTLLLAMFQRLFDDSGQRVLGRKSCEGMEVRCVLQVPQRLPWWRRGLTRMQRSLQ